MRERMRASGSDLEPVPGREDRELPAKLKDLAARVGYIVANLGAKLDHRLVHLGFDLFLEDHLTLRKNLLDVRTQLARFRIDDLEFFLNADREHVNVRRHSSLRKSIHLFERDQFVSGR